MIPSSEAFQWDSVSPHENEELSEAQCWSLIGGQETGRIAFLQDGRLLVFPVNYLVQGRTCTSAPAKTAGWHCCRET